MSKKTLILENGNIVTEQGLLCQDLLLRDGRLWLEFDNADCERIDLAGRYVLPGFIDIHMHGHKGFDFTAGMYDKAAGKFLDDDQSYFDGLTMLAETMPRYGVTTNYLATVAATAEQLGRCCKRLKDYHRCLDPDAKACKIPGVFLEGSFINRMMAGAQNPELVLQPTIDAFESIADGDIICLVNVAPETGPGAVGLIEYLTKKKDVIVGAGHTNATGDDLNAAAGAGLTYAIHFTNGPTGASYKPFNGGGATEAVLQNDDVYAELIVDGYHVNPAYILDILKRKGDKRIMAVSDAMFVTGCDIDKFNVSGVAGHANQDHSCLFVDGKKNTLFGSCLTMDRGFANMLNWLTADLSGIYNKMHQARPLKESLTALAKMFATNQAKLTGLDKQRIGSIADGNIADVTILDIDGEQGAYKVKVEKTFVNGLEVY